MVMQFVIYNEIKEKFGDHLWLDVVSKCDLLQESPVIFATDNDDDNDLSLERYLKLGPEGALHVSVKSEVGLPEVIFTIMILLSVAFILQGASSTISLISVEPIC